MPQQSDRLPLLALFFGGRQKFTLWRDLFLDSVVEVLLVHFMFLDSQELDGVVLLRQNQCVAHGVAQHGNLRSHRHFTSFQGRFFEGAYGDHGDLPVWLLD